MLKEYFSEDKELKLLFVDDDDIDTMAFKRVVKKLDYPVKLITFGTGNEALDYLTTEQPDCAFIDYQLPGIDGLTLLKKIKEIHPYLSVCVMTSQGDEKVAVDMMKAGALDYFAKDELSVDKIKMLLISISRLIRAEDERLRAQLEVKEKDELIQKIALSSPNFIYINDIEKGGNVFRNRNFVEILGYTEQEYQEQGLVLFSKIIEEEEFAKLRSYYLDVRHNGVDGQVSEQEIKLLHKDGSNVWILARDTPFKRNEEGKVVQILGTAIDITDRKEAEKQLLESKQYAEKLAKTKSEFLSNMSHEIRTPMNAIIGLTEILLKRDFKDQDLENLKAIKYSADNMLVIINDILDFSKIEAGKLNFENIDFDLDFLLNNLNNTFNPKAEQKKITFAIEKDEKIPPFLKGDPYRLNQILVNLIGNAIKFTFEGGVTVKVHLISDLPKLHLSFDVIDTGIGIPESKKDEIFESFTQAYTSTTRNFGGTGLGLAITKRLTELQGGELNITSAVGEGSNFSVRLKFTEGAPVSMEPTEVDLHEDKNPLEGINILVAEDNPVNQMLIRQVLSKWSVRFEVVDNGQDAVDFLKTHQFDIILMDLQMPVLDGFSATEQIRAQGGDQSAIPIIALTADALQETKQKIKESGLNDLITKPFKAEELLLKVSNLLA